jgi:uncharacterized membrane protein YagU involved in acid resistance
MDQPRGVVLADVTIGLIAGLVATRACGITAELLARPMPQEIKEHEERVRPEPTSRVAARKIGQRLGYRLNEQQLKLATMAVHYGLGLAWGPMYGLLRRHGRMRPLAAGFTTGATMSLVMDELVVPMLGFCPPNRAFPAATHIRGFLNHLAYGAVAALTAEAVYRLTGTTPVNPRETHRGTIDGQTALVPSSPVNQAVRAL